MGVIVPHIWELHDISVSWLEAAQDTNLWASLEEASFNRRFCAMSSFSRAEATPAAPSMGRALWPECGCLSVCLTADAADLSAEHATSVR